MKKPLNAISYFGGKGPHLNWLIPHFPKGDFHFVDIMGGGGSVSLNVNYPLQTYNDLNQDVVNLFYVLRESPELLKRLIYFTPFSRSLNDNLRQMDFEDPVYKAWRYYCRCHFGFAANGSQNNQAGMGFEWQIQRSNFYRVKNWNLKLNKLDMIITKLRTIQIENRNAFDIWDSVNKKGSFVYWDPPYVLHTRSSKKRYNHELGQNTEAEIDSHYRMCELVKDSNCLVAISGYDNVIYNSSLKGFSKFKTKGLRSNTKKSLFQEVIWTNYQPSFQKDFIDKI